MKVVKSNTKEFSGNAVSSILLKAIKEPLNCYLLMNDNILFHCKPAGNVLWTHKLQNYCSVVTCLQMSTKTKQTIEYFILCSICHLARREQGRLILNYTISY